MREIKFRAWDKVDHQMKQTKKEWEKELRIELDDIFEDAHSYTGPNIDETFDRVFVFTKQFIDKQISQAIQKAVEEREKELIEGIEEYFKGLIVIPDPQATKRNLLKELSKPKK